VDNASTDATLAAIGRFPNVRLIANEENTGFAAAVNQAGTLAQGRYLLLLNPDTIVHENAVERLVAYMDSQPGTGICAPRVLTPEGVIRYNCFAFETPWSFFCFGVGLGPLNASLRGISRHAGWNIESDRPQKVEAVTGAAMVVRRSLFESLGGLDERFFMYCEDGDFCLRARRAGADITLLPTAVVSHHGGASTAPGTERMNGMIGRHLLQSRYSYTRKYWGAAAAIGLRIANAIAGSLFSFGGCLPLSGGLRMKLRIQGRQLWATPIPMARRQARSGQARPQPKDGAKE
jgi:GT2 family glycosyltransferase